MWKVIFRDKFDGWFCEQPRSVQIQIAKYLNYLAMGGPGLGRPKVDTLHGSQFTNMKELRVDLSGQAIRIFFAFDPIRQAVVLCAGDKSNDKRFYKEMIVIADAEFAAHLAELEAI